MQTPQPSHLVLDITALSAQCIVLALIPVIMSMLITQFSEAMTYFLTFVIWAVASLVLLQAWILIRLLFSFEYLKQTR